MALSKAAYEAVAAEIKDQLEYIQAGPKFNGAAPGIEDIAALTLENTARRLAKVFLTDNERFNPDRFLKACGFAAGAPIKVGE